MSLPSSSCLTNERLHVQVAAAHHLMENTRKTVEGRAKLGIEAFAQALLGIPKTLAENSGYDAQETIIHLQVRYMICSWACNVWFDACITDCSDKVWLYWHL